MTLDPEQVVEEFLGALHAEGEPDWDRFGALLTDQAYYHTLVPMREKVTGRDAICGELQRQFKLYRDCRCKLLNIAASGNSVLTERRDHVTMLANELTGFPHEFEIVVSVCGVFEIEDGRVAAWRDYWDPADIARQVKEALATGGAA